MQRAVSYSGELRRIEALPRRKWEDYNVHKIRAVLEQACGQKRGGMTLWPVQCAALHDICVHRGGFLPIGVGQGKALISVLCAQVLEAQRPILFVPAQLRDQTKEYVLPLLKKNWKVPLNLKVLGYSELSLAKNADLLERVDPDLIILDEAYHVKSTKSGRTRRLNRWFRAHPNTMCVAMSGTICNKSIRDFAHILHWCLKNKAPVPCGFWELGEWSDALDENVPDEKRVFPGALLRFCNADESAMQGFRRRLNETPGVVASKKDLMLASIQIRTHPLKVPDKVEALIKQLRSTWVTPGGDILSEAVMLWRHIRELALGFYYRWDPTPSPEWLAARRAWKGYVRETLKHNQRNLDTELQVWYECSRAARPLVEWVTWKVIKDTFKPNSVAVWVDNFAVEAATKWLTSCTLETPGICWIEQIAFGKRLAEVSGKTYFGAGDDAAIRLTTDAAIIAGMGHSEGKELQRYSKNLVTSCPSSGKSWEQLLGRTHRAGQKADVVEVGVFQHVQELREAFRQSWETSRDTFDNRQKMNCADLSLELR